MPPKIEAAKTATFVTDDKRAQYARLIVFNHGVKEKIISKEKDVNSVSDTDLQKAFKSLNGGNLLEGKDGVALLMTLSKNGSTTGNPLTLAYAQEVRPFLRKGLLSSQFGRRGGGPRGPRTPKTTPVATTAGRTSKKGSARSSKKTTAKRSSAKRSSRSTPVAEVPAE